MSAPWVCTTCGTSNHAQEVACAVCGTSRSAPGVPSAPVGTDANRPQGSGRASAGPSDQTTIVTGPVVGGPEPPLWSAPPAPPRDTGGQRSVATGVLIAVAVLVLAAAVGIGAALVIRSGDGDGDGGRAAPEGRSDGGSDSGGGGDAEGDGSGPSGDGGGTDRSETVVTTEPSIVTTTTRPAPITTTTTVPDDPGRTLEELAAARASRVEALDGMWVPQVSSKRVGLEADDIIYGEAEILDDFRNSERQFGSAEVLIFWSGDVGSFESADFWVTVIDEPSTDWETALAWCHDRGLDFTRCYAKRILLGGPTDDTTRR